VAIHCKISNESQKTPAIKVDLFQSIKINGDNFKKEFPDIKLISNKYPEEKIEKGVIDQMVTNFHRNFAEISFRKY
jgi:hypothetical protein